MVDLDSNPTKLIEIVEIGKQMLMTRGSLTTFSIANDVAKYFAIIPAAFAATYPAARRAQRDAPGARRRRAILSAVIFNALIIVALIPLALRGVRYRPVGAARAAAAEPPRLRLGRAGRAVPRHQGSSTWSCVAIGLAEAGGPCMLATIRPALTRARLLHRADRRRLSLAVSPASRRLLFPRQANGSLARRRTAASSGSALDRPAVRATRATSGAGRRPPARARTTRPPRRARTSGRPTRRCSTAVGHASRRCARPIPSTSAGARGPGHRLRQRARPAHQPGGRAVTRSPRVAPGAGLDRAVASASWSPGTPRAATFGVLGEPRVNVLRLNLALDRVAPGGTRGQCTARDRSRAPK